MLLLLAGWLVQVLSTRRVCCAGCCAFAQQPTTAGMDGHNNCHAVLPHEPTTCPTAQPSVCLSHYSPRG